MAQFYPLYGCLHLNDDQLQGSMGPLGILQKNISCWTSFTGGQMPSPFCWGLFTALPSVLRYPKKLPFFSWTSGWAIINSPLLLIRQTTHKDRWSVLRLRRQTETSAPSPLQFVSVYAALAGARMDVVHHECKWSAWFDISNKPASVYWWV